MTSVIWTTNQWNWKEKYKKKAEITMHFREGKEGFLEKLVAECVGRKRNRKGGPRWTSRDLGAQSLQNPSSRAGRMGAGKRSWVQSISCFFLLILPRHPEGTNPILWWENWLRLRNEPEVFPDLEEPGFKCTSVWYQSPHCFLYSTLHTEAPPDSSFYRKGWMWKLICWFQQVSVSTQALPCLLPFFTILFLY